jgi:hypothetical protein
LIDFKKELQKYKPAKTLDELNNSVASGDTSDMNDFLRYITTEQITPPARVEKRARRSQRSIKQDDYE